MINQTIEEAIEKKKVIRVRYKDQPGYRLVQPHAIYVSPTEKVLVDAYQTAGYSETSACNNWRSFELDLLRGAVILDDSFVVRNDYRSESRRYQRSLSKI